LVLNSFFREGLEEAMKEIGFIKKTRHYIHPQCHHLFIDFPGTAPLGIGKDYNIKPEEHLVDGSKIKILSPTDCVKDRLATYMYFHDRDGLDQAVLVAQKHPVNFKSIKKWCANENNLQVFEEFFKLLKK